MLTNKLTKTIPVPHEDGVTVTIRKLSFGALDEARVVKRNDAAGIMKAFQGVALPSMSELQAAVVAEADGEDAPDPGAPYDRATVIKHGLTAWSLDDPVSAFTELGDDTATWLFNEIIAFSIRSAEEGEAYGSNSTAISA